MKTYLRVISFTKPYSDYTVKYFIVALLATAFGLLNFTLLIPLLDVLFEKTNETRIELLEPIFVVGVSYFKELFYYHFYKIIDKQGNIAVLQYVCFIMVIAALIANVLRYISMRIIAVVKSRLVYNLRKEIYEKMLDLHTGYFTNTHKGDLISRLTTDIQEIEISVVITLVAVFRDPIKIIFCFIILFYTSVELTFFTLIFMPLTGGITAEILKRLKKVSIESQTALGRIMGTVEESITGIKIIKAFNAHSLMYNKFKKLNHHYTHTIKKMAFKRDSASPTSEFLGIIIVAGLMLYGGNLVFNKSLDGSKFLFYIVLFTQILAPAKSISAAFSNVQRGLASANRVFEILDIKPHITNPKSPLELNDFKAKITFNNVSFEYEKGSEVLKNIDFNIPKGHTVALVGPSGSGKSTISDLIPRFFDPTKGEVQIDGKNLKHCSVNSVRHLMGIVAQEPLLFDDTIFNNIAFGIENATKEIVIQAAKVANAHNFISKTSDGYQTVIGDRGIKLSGGQKQRLSIARAVLKNPPILILDEATSALDTESEKLVQEAIANLMKNRTSVVIAHRLSTIQNANTIFVIDKGEIIERGTHQELITIENGLYSKLSKMQMT